MLKIEQRNLSTNLSGHNFSHGCPIRGHNIPRRSKLNNGSSREIQMVITFHSAVRFKRITYRDARNWTTEALKKFKWLRKVRNTYSQVLGSFIEMSTVDHNMCILHFLMLKSLTPTFYLSETLFFNIFFLSPWNNFSFFLFLS